MLNNLISLFYLIVSLNQISIQLKFILQVMLALEKSAFYKKEKTTICLFFFSIYKMSMIKSFQ